ncbi:MAG: ABC transporter substrate-binding protein [Pseudanabaenaceae cyanobacterium]|jgi:peptide/nickel transport system substrate-binding protein
MHSNLHRKPAKSQSSQSNFAAVKSRQLHLRRNSFRLWQKSWWLVAILLSSLLLIGCQMFTGAANVISRNNTMVASILTDPKTFNPVLVTDAGSGTVLSPVFTGLVSSHGVTSELQPELAASWQILDEGKRVIFNLRPDLKWSDGKPLTADDVIFTFRDVIFNPLIPSSSQDTLRIGDKREFPKIEKTNDQQIVFTLPETFAPFMRVAGSVDILPKHILEKTLQNKDQAGNLQFLSTWTLATNPRELVGSGPYTIERYQTSERFIYKPNPYYHKPNQPYIPRFIYQIVDSTDTAFLKFRSKELDLHYLRSEDFQLLKKEEQKDNFTIYNGGSSTGQQFMMFNLNRGRNPKTGKPFVDPIKSRWFNDVQFRRAIAYAIDRQAMINNLFRGLGKPQNSPISPSSPYFLSEAEGLTQYNFNPEKAKQLLKEAGYRYDATKNELTDKEGNLIRFSLMTNAGSNRLRGQIGTQIKSDLAAIGITVDFVPIDFNVLSDRIDKTREWEAILIGFTGGIEPHYGINLWAVDGNLHMFNKGADRSEPPLPGYEVAPWEKEIHELMVAAAKTVVESERKALYGKMQQLVQSELPLIHFVTPLSLAAVRNRVQGVQYSAVGGALWNLDDLKLSP